ncbi:MAG: sterol desaturase family protein [Pseudomonadota bacterium]
MPEISNLQQWLVEHEAVIRGSVFVFIFAIMFCFEWLAPRRAQSLPKSGRWLSNLSLFVMNSLILRLIFPAAAVGVAIQVNLNQWGLFNYLSWPYWIEFVLALVLMDLAIYLQHWMMHQVPWLWRLHRVHHADLDFDLTTGFRFHTLEILFSMLLKSLVIILLGPAVVAVLIFEMLLNGMAVFNHSNVSLPASLESRIRRLLVTPDMHRVHHSVVMAETNSNYGFNLSIWDRIFNTYRAQPQDGHDGMIIGLSEFRDAQQVDRLRGMLWLPFVNPRTESSH